MFQRISDLCPRIFYVIPLLLLTLADSVPGYSGSGQDSLTAILERDAWTRSSTAHPHYLKDDDPSSSFGKAAIYSYAHSAKGQRIELWPGESRGVFQTNQGTVLAITLGTRILPQGRLSNFIYIGDFTNWDNPEGWVFELGDRETFEIKRSSGRTVSVAITGGPSETKLQIIADGETMRVTMDDLFRWRWLKMLDGDNTDVVQLGQESCLLMASVVQDGALPRGDSLGVGQLFFKTSQKTVASNRREPDYAVLVVARGQRISDRIPIKGSSFELIWNPTQNIYVIHGSGEERAAASQAQSTLDKTFGPVRSYTHPSGRFKVDLPSNWKIDDLTKKADHTHVRANDPDKLVWLHIHVFDETESLSREDLEDTLVNFIQVDWVFSLFDLSIDDQFTPLEEGALLAIFRGYNRNPDQYGRDPDNQVIGSATIVQRGRWVALVGLDALRWVHESKKDLISDILKSFSFISFN